MTYEEFKSRYPIHLNRQQEEAVRQTEGHFHGTAPECLPAPFPGFFRSRFPVTFRFPALYRLLLPFPPAQAEGYKSGQGGKEQTEEDDEKQVSFFLHGSVSSHSSVSSDLISISSP